jgi:predicted HD phosphohydrolase
MNSKTPTLIIGSLYRLQSIKNTTEDDDFLLYLGEEIYENLSSEVSFISVEEHVPATRAGHLFLTINNNKRYWIDIDWFSSKYLKQNYRFMLVV